MVTFNLLPWRLHSIAYRTKQLKHTLLIACILPTIIVLLVHYLLTQKIAEQQKQVLLSKEQHSQLNQPHHAYAQLIRRAQAYQVATHFLFSNLNLPESLCLETIKRVNNTVKFTGFAYSAADLFDFLKKVEATAFFKKIEIQELQRKKEHQLRFSLQGEEKQEFINKDAHDDDDESL